jgi:hypothetical protein
LNSAGEGLQSFLDAPIESLENMGQQFMQDLKSDPMKTLSQFGSGGDDSKASRPGGSGVISALAPIPPANPVSSPTPVSSGLQLPTASSAPPMRMNRRDVTQLSTTSTFEPIPQTNSFSRRPGAAQANVSPGQSFRPTPVQQPGVRQPGTGGDFSFGRFVDGLSTGPEQGLLGRLGNGLELGTNQSTDVSQFLRGFGQNRDDTILGRINTGRDFAENDISLFGNAGGEKSPDQAQSIFQGQEQEEETRRVRPPAQQAPALQGGVPAGDNEQDYLAWKAAQQRGPGGSASGPRPGSFGRPRFSPGVSSAGSRY